MMNKYIFSKMQTQMPRDPVFRSYKLFFGTLTSTDRLLIINSLLVSPKTVSELQKALGMEQTRVSHNLRRLKQCGFVDVEQNGKFRLYTLNNETIRPLMSIINKHMKKYCLNIIARRV